jgi:hypothetical protein
MFNEISYQIISYLKVKRRISIPLRGTWSSLGLGDKSVEGVWDCSKMTTLPRKGTPWVEMGNHGRGKTNLFNVINNVPVLFSLDLRTFLHRWVENPLNGFWVYQFL